jgi:hypothetical protein
LEYDNKSAIFAAEIEGSVAAKAAAYRKENFGSGVDEDAAATLTAAQLAGCDWAMHCKIARRVSSDGCKRIEKKMYACRT